ncbi:hypothetical protein EPUL_000107 [Erysiphe pulchra]|uniref:Reverse transcriptase domain-containing protein n=1 Tax=Erysiphe pulchra TaxID=225359 RepID=A0A2S4Q247_9PEZI|nr:hypothetical protein EPUL_000107 [Erysiphe pulchra]
MPAVRTKCQLTMTDIAKSRAKARLKNRGLALDLIDINAFETATNDNDSPDVEMIDEEIYKVTNVMPKKVRLHGKTRAEHPIDPGLHTLHETKLLYLASVCLTNQESPLSSNRDNLYNYVKVVLVFTCHEVALEHLPAKTAHLQCISSMIARLLLGVAITKAHIDQTYHAVAKANAALIRAEIADNSVETPSIVLNVDQAVNLTMEVAMSEASIWTPDCKAAHVECRAISMNSKRTSLAKKFPKAASAAKREFWKCKVESMTSSSEVFKLMSWNKPRQTKYPPPLNYNNRRITNQEEPEVLFLQKPGRDPSTVKAWRPIALLSCLGKELERAIAKRMSHLAIVYDIVGTQQFGALSKRSATELISCVVHDIEEARSQAWASAIVTLDVQGTFDTVLHNRLICVSLGKNRVTSFLQRQTSVHTAMGRSIEDARAPAGNPETIRAFFELFEQTVRRFDVKIRENMEYG